MRLFRHKLVSTLAVFVLLTFSASSSSGKEFPLKIGIVADTQITTQKGSFDYGMRKKIADRISHVAIRPLAVELYSATILDHFMKKLTSPDRKVDVVLYLGDGANSGCEDEINDLFGVLENYQARVPIFFVVGNHDYLGAGNMDREDVREKLCRRQSITNLWPNRFIRKYEFLERVSAFNSRSAQLSKSKFSYTDNLPMLREIHQSRGSTFEDHYIYFLAGVVRYTSSAGELVEFLLADTSDYKDVDVPARIGSRRSSKRIGLWGLKGSVSYKGPTNQIDYLKNETSGSTPRFRIVASHYPPNRFTLLGKATRKLSNVTKRLGEWLSGGENYWVSAHTHTCKPLKDDYRVGKRNPKTEFIGLNVGSTTDFEPHVTVFGDINETNTRITDSIGFSKLTLGVTPGDIESVSEKVDEIKRGDYVELCKKCKKIKGATIIGIDKGYKKRFWKEVTVNRATENLESFLRKNVSVDWPREKLIQTLFLIAARTEVPKRVRRPCPEPKPKRQ